MRRFYLMARSEHSKAFHKAVASGKIPRAKYRVTVLTFGHIVIEARDLPFPLLNEDKLFTETARLHRIGDRAALAELVMLLPDSNDSLALGALVEGFFASIGVDPRNVFILLKDIDRERAAIFQKIDAIMKAFPERWLSICEAPREMREAEVQRALADQADAPVEIPLEGGIVLESPPCVGFSKFSKPLQTEARKRTDANRRTTT